MTLVIITKNEEDFSCFNRCICIKSKKSPRGRKKAVTTKEYLNVITKVLRSGMQ